MKVYNLYKRIMNGLAWIEKLVLIIVSILVTVITFVNVVSRYGLHLSFSWSQELVVNLFVLMIFLGCGLCAREGSLISLSLVFDNVSVKAKKIMTVIITVFSLWFYVVLVQTGFAKTFGELKAGKETFSLGWPQWVFTIFLPIGAVLLVLHTIEFMVDVLHGDAACVRQIPDDTNRSDTFEGGND